MLPLIRYLPCGGRNRIYRTQWANLAFIKSVTTRCCLGMNILKIRVDGATRQCTRPKALPKDCGSGCLVYARAAPREPVVLHATTQPIPADQGTEGGLSRVASYR